MKQVKVSLNRLETTFSDFIGPPAVLHDIPALKQQIELRRRALYELQLIRSRLGPLMQLRWDRLPGKRRIGPDGAIQGLPSSSRARPRHSRR